MFVTCYAETSCQRATQQAAGCLSKPLYIKLSCQHRALSQYEKPAAKETVQASASQQDTQQEDCTPPYMSSLMVSPFSLAASRALVRWVTLSDSCCSSRSPIPIR